MSEKISILLRNITLFNEESESLLEHVFSVVLPHSSEVGLVREESLLFMGVYHIFLGDHFRNNLASSLPFLFEFFSALWGGGVNAEDKLVILISMSETVKLILNVVKMTTVSEPVGLGDFVVEES